MARPVQWVAFAGRFGTGERHHPLHGPIAQERFAGPAGGIAQQPVDAGLGKALLPAPHRGPADAGAFGNLGDAQPFGRAEDDPSPRRMLLGAVAIGDDRLQPSAILSRDQGTDGLSHAPSIAHPSSLVNPLFASVH
jgi:hypothetical protein